MIRGCNRAPDDLDVAIGRRIRRRRQVLRASLATVAAAIGISVRRLSQYEMGMVRAEPAHLVALADVLGMRISSFFIDVEFDAGVSPLAGRSKGRDIVIARARSISYLPIMIMEHERLVEKAAKKAGLGEISVTYSSFDIGAFVAKSVTTGKADFGASVTTAFLSAWDKTYGTDLEVKAICALSDTALYLFTRNPKVHSLSDFSCADRINVILPKISNQAIMLEMAVASSFGITEYARLDDLTVGLLAPEAAASLVSGTGEITTDFCNPPFSYQETANPDINQLLSSDDIFDGPATFSLLFTTSSFYQENPQIVLVVRQAVEEAIALIHQDRRGAADVFEKLTDPRWALCCERMLHDPKIVFQTHPHGLMKYAHFMHQTGMLRNKPGSWQDCFFSDEAAGLTGN